MPRRQQAPAAAVTALSCPRCGTPAGPDQAFCERCGADLRPAAAPAPAAAARLEPTAPAACPHCGSLVSPGEQFCTRCGYALAPPAAPPEPARSAGARLLMADNRALELPAKAEVVVGREDPLTDHFPDIDLTPFGAGEQGVSRRHARITRDQNGYYVEDLESKNHTFVNEQRLQPGERRPLQPGDTVRFGRVAATFQFGRQGG
jgi:hypothetical protein